VKASTFKYRSRKRNATDTFAVRHRLMNVADDKQSVPFYARFFKKFGVGNAWIATSEPIDNPPQYDCKLQWDKRVGGCLFHSRSSRATTKPFTVRPWRWIRVCATARRSTTRSGTKSSSGAITTLGALCVHLDKLVGKIDTARVALRMTSRQERLKAVTKVVNLKRAAGHVRVKIRNLVNDLHHHLAKYLVENYELILLPAFHTSEMVPRKTVRSMLTWSHYRFQQFLLHKAREYPGCHVALVCEGYTSKCCSRCGAIHWTIKRSSGSLPA
jgi:IS605 OrfB family transposase